MRSMYKVAILVSGLVLLTLLGIVNGQSDANAVTDNCNAAMNLAKDFAASDQCGCGTTKALPICGETCLEEVLIRGKADGALCRSGCQYCDATAASNNCGVVDIGVVRGPLGLDLWIGVIYTWTYTTGPKVGQNVVYAVDNIYGATRACRASINGQQCSSCSFVTCPGSDSDGNGPTVEPRIDCTNLAVNATATPCTGRAGGGWVSLTAAEQDSALGPLNIPTYGCLQKTVTTGLAAPVLPVPTSGAEGRRRCGLLGLGLLCLRGSGVLRRLLGLCK